MIEWEKLEETEIVRVESHTFLWLVGILIRLPLGAKEGAISAWHPAGLGFLKGVIRFSAQF